MTPLSPMPRASEPTGGHVQTLAREAFLALDALATDLARAAQGGPQDTAPPGEGAHDSTTNLIHYLALRSGDRRSLQKQLAALGLSSLGRAEPAVMHAVAMTRHAAGRLIEPPATPGEPVMDAISLDRGRGLLDARTDALLGPRPRGRVVRLMVTMPTEAAHDPAFIPACMERGMDAIRINTAHDTPEEWMRLIEFARAAERASGRTCRVFADLAGPKIRTHAIDRRGKPRDAVRLRVGDVVALVTDAERAGDSRGPLSPAERGVASNEGVRARIVAGPREAFARVRAGHEVWFDDGAIGAIVESTIGAGNDAFVLRVTHTRPGGKKLRLDRGINLPDSDPDLPAITTHDAEAISLLAPHIDGLGLSFVRSREDVEHAQSLVESATRSSTALVAKIETRRAFEELPSILLQLLATDRPGVMIARGDLAVECGFERLAEVQEVILWLCEAAHVPVIWATEVLASLAKEGVHVRAEYTDAAMAQRAECVMLNKGPEILQAITALDDVLTRMAGHQRKKMSTLRPLSVARQVRRG